MPLENLVFEGGGVHGLAYVGCVRALEQQNQLVTLRRVGGTSIGALIAAFLACALSSTAMEHELQRLSKRVVLGSVSLCRLVVNIARRFGAYDMSRGMRSYLREIMQRYMNDADVTLGGVLAATGRELHICVFNSTRMCSETLSSRSHPHVHVVDALVAAMSVQAMFVPLPIPGTAAGDVYSDDGLTNNMPLSIFDTDDDVPNPHTLGIRSVASNSILFANEMTYTPPPPRNIVEYLSRLASLLIEAGQQRYERPRDAERTLFLKIPASIGSFDFDLTPATRTRLVQLGHDGIVEKAPVMAVLLRSP